MDESLNISSLLLRRKKKKKNNLVNHTYYEVLYIFLPPNCLQMMHLRAQAKAQILQ